MTQLRLPLTRLLCRQMQTAHRGGSEGPSTWERWRPCSQNIFPQSSSDLSRYILLSDDRSVCKGDKAAYQAQLHLYYYLFPALCKACSCANPSCSCPNYACLFDTFLQDTARPPAHQINKRQIPVVLAYWHKWGQQQHALGQLTAHQLEICHGPGLRVRTFDRASIAIDNSQPSIHVLQDLFRYNVTFHVLAMC